MSKCLISVWDVIVFLLSLILFYGIALGPVNDIQLHAEFIHLFAGGEIPLPPNFAYYVTVYAFALFNSDPLVLLGASTLTLALAVAAKFSVTRIYAYEYLRSGLGQENDRGGSSVLISGLLILAFSLPAGTNYLGQIPPNVWHNSTTIFVMPLALLLFWESYAQLESPAKGRIAVLCVLCIANLVAKPSYVFVFFVAYPLLLFFRWRFGREFWLNLTPVLIGVGGVVLEYSILYWLARDAASGGESGVIVAPFLVWSHFSACIPLSLVASSLFPLVYLFFYWRDLVDKLVVQYAAVGYLVGIAIFAILAETGPRQFHGNFGWQAIIASYVLFMVLALRVIERTRMFRASSWRDVLIALAFLAHVGAGVRFLSIYA